MKSLEIVIACAKSVAELTANENLDSIDVQTRLFGGGGIFDSMDLVMLTVEIEQFVHDQFGKVVVLASERAMSRTTSPFRTVKTMADYLDELLTESM